MSVPTAPPAASGAAPLSDHDIYLFREGTHTRLAGRFGCRLDTSGAHFAVWAPNARAVSVIGEFNGWDPTAHPLAPRWDSSGIWEGRVDGVAHGQEYKFRIEPQHGAGFDKADPFAVYAQPPPQTASRAWSLDYDWHDGEWMADRGRRNALSAPLSIYEVHLGSWRRRDGRMLDYREAAHELADYAVTMGFTHVELLPLTEHPFYGSWGYQCTGYFAATARYGTPQDLKYLVDHLHQRGIGVILDWVPSHFPDDPHGLSRFDGTHLYEHADPRQGYHPDWHSSIFNYGRHEVRAFLLSSAHFWLDEYHFDGLRVDAVASMLYLDYSRKAGEWLPNAKGGRENIDAVEFLQAMNRAVYGTTPGFMTVAEESTSWPKVSHPVYEGGLGFGFKWNMGFMNDTLRYMAREAVHRRYHHDEITFGLMYAFTENFVLPLSHDEVVHGKGTLLSKMSGDDWQKFASLRAYYAFMWGYPGKKLLFMGQEFAQRNEWSEARALDWHELEHAAHRGVRDLVRDLNRTYRSRPALHARDCEGEGFEWLVVDDTSQSVFAWLRKAPGANPVAIVSNFTPAPRPGYRLPLPMAGRWREILNTDAREYGGGGMGNGGNVEAAGGAAMITVPPLSTLWLEYDPA